MNQFIMHTYYKATILGRDLIGYRQRLIEEFKRFYPEHQVTDQRLADQYGMILRNNLIPDTRLKIPSQAKLNMISEEILSIDNEDYNQQLDQNESLKENSTETEHRLTKDPDHCTSLSAEIKAKYFLKYNGLDLSSRSLLLNI